jgi:hypothetical protein
MPAMAVWGMLLYTQLELVQFQIFVVEIPCDTPGAELMTIHEEPSIADVEVI